MSLAIILSAIFTTALINNLVVFQFLGLYKTLDIKEQNTAKKEMVLAVMCVLFLSVMVTYVINQLVLIPLELLYAQVFVYVIVLMTVMCLLKVSFSKLKGGFFQSLNTHVPLITSNSVILGSVMMVTSLDFSTYSFGTGFIVALLYAVGAGLGFGTMVFIFSTIQLRLKSADVPKNWAGVPILLITAGIITMILMGLNGIF
jgi:electron transport complex protein RnfA